MINAALNFYTYCEKSRTSWSRTYRWEEWKAVFKETGNVENVEARNEALSAAATMDTAERIYKPLQMKGERQMATRGMSEQSERSATATEKMWLRVGGSGALTKRFQTTVKLNNGDFIASLPWSSVLVLNGGGAADDFFCSQILRGGDGDWREVCCVCKRLVRPNLFNIFEIICARTWKVWHTSSYPPKAWR